MKSFEDYSRQHINFNYPDDMPDMLREELENHKEKIRVLDIGCGDCNLLKQIKRFYGDCKKDQMDLLGLDLSLIRINRSGTGINVVCSDAARAGFKDRSFDLIVCTQVIEHVSDDRQLLAELKRIMKNGGRLYITSVVKKKYAWYIYKNYKGEIVSDPTHLREYRSEKDFIDLLSSNGYRVIKMQCRRFRFPIVDLFLRALIIGGIVRPEAVKDIYITHRWLSRCRRWMFICPPGYYNIEAVAEFQKDR